MERRSRRKSRYTLVLIAEKGDGTMNKHAMNSAVFGVFAAIFFVSFIVLACKTVYDSIIIKDIREEVVEQSVTINNLTDENEALSVENATLTNKIGVLSQTVSLKAEAEDALSQETIENALPKGFPLSGSATMKEAEEGDPMLVFTASPGTNVITSGTGTVVSVDMDETYGMKVVLDHGNGYQSVYRNNGTALVKNGETLGKGYIIFSLGEDNQELGYQIMQNDQYIDPMTLIDING
ncbi:murein hydrolase activator EnvC [Lachnospiraceae bacterium]|jgi:Membrane-bound metallopeptidase|nr:murein hydrolase activator EnvC [Lachnospiraceae bacterium]